MGSNPRRAQGIVAAGLLSILTVAAFARAQYSGPESAVLRYHIALSQGDAESLAAFIVQDPEAPSAKSMNSQTTAMLSTVRDFQIAAVTHKGREASVDVVYRSVRYGTVLVRFVLVKPRGAWQLDSERTRGLVQRART